ncbi:MAG: N-methyl-L-tryptophan oxidase [Cyclobacteriaceae bacterium]
MDRRSFLETTLGMATATTLPLSELQAAVREAPVSSEESHYDVIVIGVGSMGAATCHFLASRGHRVLGLEQFDITHDQGSHAGQSRLIRKAYFEHPDYVPLLERSYQNWRSLEKETGAQVYFPTGLVYVGHPKNALMTGVRLSSDQFKVPVETWSAQKLASTYPQFVPPAGADVLMEPDAGFLTPERAILLYVRQAMRAGARIQTKEKVLQWKQDGTGVQVTTNRGTYSAQKLVITAGPWAGQISASLRPKLTVTKQVVVWTKPRKWTAFELGKFPCWAYAPEGKPGLYYGFPIVPVEQFGGPLGLKLGYHVPGIISDPDAVNRDRDFNEEKLLTEMLRTFMPDACDEIHVQKSCLYTNTPDEHFVLDLLPDTGGRVAIAAGFSGHGFKFASAVGEIMADLAMNGKTSLPIDFLRFKRFAQ